MEKVRVVLVQCQVFARDHPKLRTGGLLSCIGAGFLLTRLVYKKARAYIKKSPPALHGLPFFGSLITMMIWGQDFTLKLLPSCGDLVTYNLGPVGFCRINSIDLATKLLNVAINRPNFMNDIMVDLGQEESFAGINEDRQWSFRRRKMMNDLLLVLNTEKFETNYSKLLQSITYKYLDSKLSEDSEFLWYPREYIRNMTCNSLYLAMFGKTLDIESKKYKDISWCIKTGMEDGFGAYLKYILPSSIGEPLFGEQYRNLLKSSTLIYDIVNADYQEVKQRMESKESTQSAQTNAPILAEYYVQEDKLSEMRTIVDLEVILYAGIDTSSHISELGIALLAKYPSIQEQMYNEVKQYTSSDNEEIATFVLRQTKNCPLLRAFVHEALRIARTIPGSVYRTTDKDIRCMKLKNGEIICNFIDAKLWMDPKYNTDQVLYDYVLSKDYLIETNIDFISVNEKVWSLDNNAQKLNLNYWLKKDETGTIKFAKNKNSIPFSVGFRECPGQSLAMKQLCAFFANVVLKYKIDRKEKTGSNDGIVQIYSEVGDANSSFKEETCVRVSRR